jgi:hydrogenase nickel incorporation protein HypA/HybF
MALAQNILDIIDETLSKEKFTILKEVVVEIGELVAVVPDSLQFCYAVLTEKTPYQDSRLSINILPLQAKCMDCNLIFKIINMSFICPACQSQELEIVQGQELKISYVEVD